VLVGAALWPKQWPLPEDPEAMAAKDASLREPPASPPL
jgi:hypothetical protein